MVIKIKLKYIIGFVIATALLTAINIGAFANTSSNAYVKYRTDSSTVTATVYWTTEAGLDFAWANDMNSDNSGLNWQSKSFQNIEGNLSTASVIMDKYKNYYFKIYNPSDSSKTIIVRAFPGDVNSESGPNRKMEDYAHGNFSPDTKMCGSCHNSHASLKSQLLRQSTYYDLCMLCHSNSNSQSKYDVEMGKVYMGPTTGWVDSLAGPIGEGVASSGHFVNDNIPSQVNVMVPGGAPDHMLTFTCVSCHTAHGSKDDNYRLIRKNIYPGDGLPAKGVNFNAYSIVKDLSAGEQAFYVSGNSEFCVSCHSDYADPNTSTHDHPVTVGSVVYSVYSSSPYFDLYPSSGDKLPLQYCERESKNNDKRTAVVCSTCHFAHGTRKSFVVDGKDSTGNLLRLDNYGVCQSCHKK